ncbi:DUF2344 domain-containing protein [Candidatus Syntrophosphaera thermopropionivorans]|jgi:uncharacterized protein (DUF2344 family)|uniref:Uncharacterized protein n=1 Tax=Candidatus Syntrophosphaera thermopropionivorans TaxID=2593015 RepID=A0AC61QK50_9BACT|nr:DUF2344 domain-containing protein [Candidatus Syntrophosphaera thermopropionivorans]TDF73840.1 hypothetical protein E0946_02155 [Candidatus Syntrophosphaera thermopropionivorans]
MDAFDLDFYFKNKARIRVRYIWNTLPLGVESICEYFDISLYSPYTQEDIISSLTFQLTISGF